LEHRWGKRTTLDLAVKLHLSSGAVVPGRIANASLSGALVRINARVPPLSRVLVELVTGNEQLTRAPGVAAYAVREMRDQVGLEWVDFSPPAVVALLSYRADGLHGNTKLRPDPCGHRSTVAERGSLLEQRP